MDRKNQIYIDCLNYMEDAKLELQKSKLEKGVYQDIEQVKKACSIADQVVTIAFAEYINQIYQKTIKKYPDFNIEAEFEKYKLDPAKSHKSFKLTKQQFRINNLRTDSYEQLYLIRYKQGTTSEKIVLKGFKTAYKIIELIK